MKKNQTKKSTYSKRTHESILTATAGAAGASAGFTDSPSTAGAQSVGIVSARTVCWRCLLRWHKKQAACKKNAIYTRSTYTQRQTATYREATSAAAVAVRAYLLASVLLLRGRYWAYPCSHLLGDCPLPRFTAAVCKCLN